MYITYMITNVITQEFYIGSHKTDDLDDDYMGSGKLIKESIKIYGKEAHKKDILGIFDTRKESLELEHKLIRLKKNENKNKCLNIGYGGFSFDYINENLTFDRAKFGSMASHETQMVDKQKRIEDYNSFPNLCLFCGSALPYEKRHSKFCSNSCSASFNNPKRLKKVYQKNYCRYCGKEIAHDRKFCNNSCSSLFYKGLHGKTPLQKKLLENKEKIEDLHNNGKSYREIGLMFGTSGNSIKDLLKGRI